MQDFQTLAMMLRELEDQMISCMKCGMCQAACPLYAQTMREADVARGKIALLENLSKELLQDPEGVQKRLDRCLLCGSCQAACPSGVKVMQILLRARVIINRYLGLPYWQRLIFRGMLSRPWLFDSMTWIAARCQAPFVKTYNQALGSSCARIQTSFLKNRHFPKLSKRPWHSTGEYIDTFKGDSGLKVGLYIGCLVDKLFPQVGHKLVNLLRQEQVWLYAPKEVVCCGIPALAGGDWDSFSRLVRKNLQIFDQAKLDYLTTPCATCTATIREVWPLMAELFSDQEKKKIYALSNKTVDFSQLLVDKLQIPTGSGQDGQRQKVTYHDPCHLKKSLGISRQPRELIIKNPNLELVEMSEADGCCGMGGSFNLKHYNLSKKIGARKLKNILDTGANIVSTSCPACMVQLIDLLSESDQEVLVRHVLELYVQGSSSNQNKSYPGNNFFECI